MKQFKSIKAPPGAKRLIESLRGLGYESQTAIADIIDNSISADATEVYVDVFTKAHTKVPAIVIADNGNGMDREALIEAMRFGADQEYSSDDLGKYGLGLKTASLSQCRVLTVASKPRPQRGRRSFRNVMRWDLDHVYSKDDWDLLALDEKDIPDPERDLLFHRVAEEHGTVVLWTDLEEVLPDLYRSNGSDRFLARLLENLEVHLSMVFHRFLEGRAKGRSKLRIFLAEKELTSWDPFSLKEKSTQSIPPEKYKFDSKGRQKKITVSPYILPPEDLFSTHEARKAAAGPRGWNQQQGFYFYRNDRMLQSGGWSYMRAPDEHTKLLRVAVDFSGELDREFEINVTKMRAKIPSAIWDSLKEDVSKWAQKARQVYDSKGGRSSSRSRASGKATAVGKGAEPNNYTKSMVSSPDLKLGPVSMSLSNAPSSAVSVSNSGGTLKLLVPFKHLSATAFHAKKGRTVDQRNIMLALLAIIDAVRSGALKPDNIPIDHLKKLVQRTL